MAFAVGVLGGIETALGMGHVPEDVGEDVAGDGGVAFLAADQGGIQVQLGQLGVVVEHLLEMRDQPLGIHGIAGEAAAQLVMDAAGGHAVAGVEDHAKGLRVLKTFGVAQQEPGLAWVREFGGRPKPPWRGS